MTRTMRRDQRDDTRCDATQAEAMRRAGRLVALAHQAVKAAVVPGISTRELDAIAEKIIIDGGGIPAFKGYNGFPATACMSVNEAVVHGFPNRRRLVEGDIVSVDLGSIVDGHYGDSAWTYAVGAVSAETQRLLDVTEASLMAGLAMVRAGVALDDVSSAIQDVIDAAGFGIVKEYCGHGIGRVLHGFPQIPNYRTGDTTIVLEAGMCLAIEPMVNMKGAGVRTKSDGWTVVTRDGGFSAHFEHTVMVTETGCEIMTTLDK